MKKITFVVAAFAISVFGYAQKLDPSAVPAAVKTAFAKSFPKATEVKWSKEHADELEAEFRSDGQKMSANFTNAGAWTGTEFDIKKSELPKIVLDSIAKVFPGYKIDDPEKAEEPGKGVFYKMKVEKDDIKYKVQLSAEGRVLKKEGKKKKKEKGEKKKD